MRIGLARNLIPNALPLSSLSTNEMGYWFQCKIKILRETGEGLVKSVTENYLVDAMTFTEAENRIIQELGSSNSGELNMQSMSRSNIKEVVFYGDTDRWFKAKVTYVTLDEEAEKEKKVVSYLLINSETVREAYDRIQEHTKEWLVPLTIIKIEESNIVDVIEYQPGVPSHLSRVEGSAVQVDPETGEVIEPATAGAEAAAEGEEGAVGPGNGPEEELPAAEEEESAE